MEASSENFVARGRKARKLHSPYERKSALVEANKSEYLGEDRISKLPDEILIPILSFLTIKEAGRSSVLSCRWKNLWTFFTGRLDIGYKDHGTLDREGRVLTEVFEMLENYQHSFEYKSDKLDIVELGKGLVNLLAHYDEPVKESRVVWHINNVLKRHQGLFLDKVGIHLPYLEKYSCDVDSWVKLASRKVVGRFELDLEPQMRHFDKQYKLRGVKRLFSSSNPSNCNFSSLTCLHLRYVNVSGKILEHFLANCHFLIQLRVISSSALVKLNVTGPSLKLELLEVSSCDYLRVLNISAENLVSLVYDGPSQPLVLHNVPLLSEMSIAGDILSSLSNKSCMHFRSIQQLESLRVKMEMRPQTRQPKFRPKFPVLHCLKQLELDIQDTYGEDLMFYVSLVKACPFLYRLTMRYIYEENEPDVGKGEELRLVREREKRLEKTDKTPIAVTAEFQHLSLKMVQLVGFIGYETDLELVFSLVKIAVSLEKLVIEPCKYCPGESRRRAWELEAKLPSNVNLSVL